MGNTNRFTGGETKSYNNYTYMEISISKAISELRKEIDKGIWYWARKITVICIEALFLLGLVILGDALLFTLFNHNLGSILFIILFSASNLSFILVPLLIIAYSGLRNRGKGIEMGMAYQRITEQYANVEAGSPRSTSVMVKAGSKGRYFIDYLKEPNPHVLMVGSTSSGKTTTMRTFIGRIHSNYKIPFLMIDWNGESEQWAGKMNAKLWKVPENFKINPFKLNDLTIEARASMVEEMLVVAGRLTQLQATRVKDIFMAQYTKKKEVTLDSVVEKLRESGTRNAMMTLKLSAIWRIIGEEPQEFWDSIFTTNTVISLTGLNTNQKAVVAYCILQRICELFEKSPIVEQPRLIVVVDEAWQLLSSSEELEMQESLAEKVVRVGRRYGFGIITSTQQLEDLPSSFINSSALIFLHNYKYLWYGKEGIALNVFDRAYLACAAQGECLIYDRLRFQKGQTLPDYVKIKPLSKEEIEEFNENKQSF